MSRFQHDRKGSSHSSYTYQNISIRSLTFAVGSADFMALNAENEVVPPPINKYLTFFGMSFGSDGNLMTDFSKYTL